jgi:predicted nucleic acid-binding protein
MGSVDLGSIPVGSTVLLDTAPIIYFFEHHPTFEAHFAPVFEAHADGQIEFAISSITVAELLVRPFQRGNEALARTYRTRLMSWLCVEVSADIAESAARIRASHGVRLADAIQAATAIAISAAALVSNDKAFQQIPSLRILG